MTSTLTRCAAITLLACGAHGCVSTTPHWDSRFGASTRANLAVQAIDPAASSNRNPAVGLDGPAARAAIDNYQRGFAKPETGQPAALIGTR